MNELESGPVAEHVTDVVRHQDSSGALDRYIHPDRVFV
jgi:hypothetical protein